MKLLIVDDEPMVLDFLKQAAVFAGATQIEVASSGEEALTHVVKDDYDLITLDIHMPGASGLEILSLVRNMCPHAIIAIVSGNARDEMLTDMAGCVDLVMHKPVDLNTFNKLLDGVKQHTENLSTIRALSQMDVPLSRNTPSIS